MKTRVRFAGIIIFAVLLAGMFASTGQAQGTAVSLPPCSAAVHALYHLTGPDGAEYPTWHPVLDFKRGCFHDHEHGSDPSLFSPGWGESTAVHPNWPAFGYTASHHGMTEPHPGFKNYIFQWGGFSWMVTQHQGSGNAQAASCNRHHTLDIQIKDGAGVLVADLHMMGDYGRATANSTGLPELVPAACPDQAALAAGSNGVRQFPVVTTGNIGYEPWRADTGPTVFGFYTGGLVTNVGSSAKTACADLNCSSNVVRMFGSMPHNGAYRFVEIPTQIGFDPSGPRGEFWTDPMGETILDETDPGAVRQFIAPGLTLLLQPPGPHCYPFTDAQLYICDPGAATINAAQYQKNIFVTGGN